MKFFKNMIKAGISTKRRRKKTARNTYNVLNSLYHHSFGKHNYHLNEFDAKFKIKA